MLFRSAVMNKTYFLGTNVQSRLVAVHHLDVGWKPSDMTQRNGRIIRQGNMKVQYISTIIIM